MDSDTSEKHRLVKFYMTEEEQRMVDELKSHYKTTARTKVFRRILKQTYDTVKNLWGDKK